MSSTNQTTTLNLPQWVGSDKPTFLGDMNNAFSNIDNYAKENNDNITQLTETVETHTTELSNLKNSYTTQQTQIQNVVQSTDRVIQTNEEIKNTQDAINKKLGNASLNTSASSITGAINELVNALMDSGKIINLVYPIGKIEAFSNDVNPNDIYLGTTWERCLQGLTPIGYDENNTKFNLLGKTLGSDKIKANLSNTAFAQIAMALGSRRIQGKQVETTNWNSNAEITNNSGSSASNPIITNNGINVAGTTNEFEPYQPSQVVAYWVRTA